jgi:hypothetical protein
MRARYLLKLALTLNITILVGLAAAQPPTTQSYIEYGDYQVQTGNLEAALNNYNVAYNLARQSTDPYSMLTLSGKYLALHYEPSAAVCFVNAAMFARQRATYGGQYYSDAMSMMQIIVDYYNKTLRLLPASQETQAWFAAQAQEASNFLAAQNAPPQGRPPLQPPECGRRSSTPNWDDLPCVPYFPR